MGFSLSGYVLEKPRVGTANSPFTATPDNYVSNSGAFNAAYPSSEGTPRSDYLVFVDSTDGNLPSARFAWTKNEGAVSGTTQIPFPRFDFEGASQRFRPLPGGPPDAVGVLTSDANTTHLKVPKPSITDLTNFPIRVSVGSSGSGTTFTANLVATDANLTPLPPSGSVNLSRQSGKLSWNAADLVSFADQEVRFQRQSFFTYQDSSGRLGSVSDTLLLSPIPKTGQVPLVRIGAGLPLTAIEVATEGSFGSPSAGTFQWARDTGRLRLSTADVSASTGKGVYYDGVVFARGLALSTTNIGAMPAGYTSLTFTATAGGDLVFRVGSRQFPQLQLVDAFSDATGQVGVVQVKIVGTSGEARFSAEDRGTYVGQTVQLTNGDLTIDHGVSLRLYRNPVNLDAADSSLKDVSSIYTVERAVLAQPMIAQPQVFLPARPIDATGYPISVYVEQGMGSFTGPLPRLDVASPPTGLGVVFDFDQNTVQYAQRKTGVIASLVEPAGAVALPDPLVFAGNANLELETAPGSGTYAPLTVGTDALFEPLSGVVSFVTTQGTLLMRGSGTTTGGVLVAPAGNFVSSGVLPGDVVIVEGTTAAGMYTVKSVTSASQLVLDVVGPNDGPFGFEVRRGREILVDRFFDEVVLADPATKVEKIRALGAPTNSPRLNVGADVVSRVRFRFDTGTFATTVNIVANDGLFSDPSMMSAGTVEVSASTGNVNLSTTDIGTYTTVYQVVRLRQQVDYKLSPGLGLISFTERLLAYDEALITYVPLDDEGNKLPVVTEEASFLVRLEVTQPHTSPTSTLQFNPTGRRLATAPLPQVYRGGRPQVLGEQCAIDSTTSTIVFLPDDQITDALPHGSIVGPEERVYVNYYVTQALGGEGTTSVLQTPMSITRLVIRAGDTSFTLSGDWTASFPANYLLRIESEEVYMISDTSYDATSDVTTVRIALPQEFNTDYTSPRVYVSSGPTPFYTTPLQPAYFVTEAASFEPVPRGSNKMVVTGDRTSAYKTGTVVGTTDAGASFLRFYEVTGTTYDAASGKTTVMFSGATSRQVVYGSQIVKHTVRPVLGSPSAELMTGKVPVLSLPYTLYRRTTGLPGNVLGPQPNADYKLDDAGRLTLATPLAKNEEIGLLYTGHVTIEAGRNLRAAYTSIIAPSADNGLLNQALRMDYSLYSPDTFYYRVETFSNFRGELAQQYTDEAKSSSPSGGPTTSNGSSPQLFEQGRPSLYFNEGRYANEDIVARSSLKFYNDAVNILEDVLADFDGRVVGGRSGKFRFDGNLTNAAVTSGNIADAANQIDDRIKISDAPYQVTMTGLSFTLTPIGTYKALWEPSVTSRFYPTYKRSFGVTAAGSQTGDQIMDLAAKSTQSVSNVRTRPAFALVKKDAAATAATLTVDAAQGEAATIRPAFLNGMKCVIQKADGSFLKAVGAEVVVSSATATTITLTAPVGVAIPAGSTIYRSPADDSNFGGDPKQPGPNANFHFSGSSYGVDNDNGLLLYVKAFPPLDGSVVLVPDALVIKQIPAGMPLDTDTFYSNRLTAPYRAPVFDGGTLDDDGNISLPLVGPTLTSEVPTIGEGLLDTELATITTLTSTTQTPFTSTATLDGTKTILTLTSGTFPAPVPEIYDLVRITTGNNTGSAFRRVTAVTPTTLTVDTAFTSTESGPVNFIVTVSGSTVTGTAAIAGTTLTDGLATFTTSVVVGQTVIITSGASAGERRQIVAILSNTQLQLTATIAVGGTYRVDNSLATFGGVAGTTLTSYTSTLTKEVALLSTQPSPQNEIAAIEAFFNLCFTDVETGTATVSGTTLTDGAATFLTSGVNATNFVYVRAGASQGIYQVATVPSETQLTVSSAFPTATTVSYRAVSSFGAGFETLTNIFGILVNTEAFLLHTQAMLSVATTAWPVVKPGNVPDPSAWATALSASFLSLRSTTVTARKTQVAGEITKITTALTATEKLYDKRFVWIDARINMEKGLLIRKAQAVTDRLKAQTDLINQLTKLLAVET